MSRWGYQWAPYVPVAERRAEALREVRRRAKKGEVLAPVVIEGRNIAHSVWGKAWCLHMERHADAYNRLGRGRTYARNGAVIDLKIAPGRVDALVSGSSIYTVTISVDPVPPTRWAEIAADCAGHIDSIVELLEGRLSAGVMLRLCDPERGIFPRARQMRFTCSCPDGASMCKHVAAALFGVGARLDTRPELLFTLRQVDQTALVPKTLAPTAAPEYTLGADDDLAALFGLDIEADVIARPGPVAPVAVPAAKATPLVKAAVSQPVVDEVWLFLSESPELEFPLEDIYSYQDRRPRRSRAALRGAIDTLVAEGRVELSDVEDGVEYWRAVGV